MEKIQEMEKEKREVRTYFTPSYKETNREKDRHYPEGKDDYNYEAYLVAVLDAKTDVQYNFEFADGKRSKVSAERALTPINISKQALEIRKIIIYYNSSDGMCFGFAFFDE